MPFDQSKSLNIGAIMSMTIKESARITMPAIAKAYKTFVTISANPRIFFNLSEYFIKYLL